MDELLGLGFEHVGEWTNDRHTIAHNIQQHLNENNLLYAFVINETPKYIGKTTQSLSQRMTGYRNANGNQHTNIRIKENILQQLAEGSEVKIIILRDNANIQYGGFNINLAAGLEDNLIYAIAPEWNFLGNNRIIENDIPNEDMGELLENNIAIDNHNAVLATFPRVLTATCLGGVINFPAAVRIHLPVQLPTPVTVFLDDNAFVFQANLIDRANNQPTINSVIYANWLTQKNLQVGDTIQIDIIEPTIFRIYTL